MADLINEGNSKLEVVQGLNTQISDLTARVKALEE
jgi:hypothetical protein|tara:strand:- start:2309 stop:2413 length:105 start_codon:yes stop_codon:yes gene_type:complete